jgi:hypothetical protein
MGIQRLSVLCLAAAVLAASLLGGCGRSTRGQNVAIDGIKLSQEHPTVVDVENWNGTIRVIADPTVKQPLVTARVRATSKQAPKAGTMWEAVDVTATASIAGTERLLKVVSAPATNPPKDVAVDLTIRVSKVAATRIRNSGGGIELVRVNGPVTVENGVGGGPGGDIQLRTGEVMTFPATLTTTAGRVIYQVGVGSTGQFDLQSEKGETVFTTRTGELDGVVPNEGHYRATLNKGTNPVILRSGDGVVTARVMENAATYGPEVWDGTFRWPSKPRFIGRLGGYYNDEPARLPWQKRPAAAPAASTPAEAVGGQ